jgi:hypothetical protein
MACHMAPTFKGEFKLSSTLAYPTFETVIPLLPYLNGGGAPNQNRNEARLYINIERTHTLGRHAPVTRFRA